MPDEPDWIPEPARFELDPADSKRLAEILAETAPRTWRDRLRDLAGVAHVAHFSWTLALTVVLLRLTVWGAPATGPTVVPGTPRPGVDGPGTSETAVTPAETDTCRGRGEPPARPDPLSAHLASSPGVIFGIDVSSFQGPIDWTAVGRSGVQFSFLRVSQGDSFVDPCFATHYAAAGASRMRRGAYHVLTATNDGAAQARHFLDTLDQAGGTLEIPPAVDLEMSLLSGVPPSALADELSDWVAAVRAARGVTPLVYASRALFYSQYEASRTEVALPVWLADYTVVVPESPPGWSPWSFWQFSSSGTVDGISGAVDLDRFAGTLAELDTLGRSAVP